ncbi:hypothetical protein, partial [Pontiella sp.]|uniref:hypothetical protein n=1 Tax=Pontiella sp. TaxID=2837462 RepID=UPI0035657BBB
MIVLKSKPAFLSSLAGALLSAAGVQAVGLYEAENAAYVHGSVKTDANASGGEYLDGNGDFNVTWTVDAEGGDYNLS